MEEVSEEVYSQRGDKSWMVSTTKALYKTLPFDAYKAILFLPERGKDQEETEDEEEDGGETFGKITGDEAKEFYENVISMPKQSAISDSDTVRHKQRKVVPGNDTVSKQSCRRSSRSKRRRYPSGSGPPTEGTQHNTSVSQAQLFWYAQDGDLTSLTLALSQGTYDINTTDHFDWTLLMCASRAGHVDIVQYLLSQGAQLRGFVDRGGNSAVDLARKSGHFHIAELIEEWDSHYMTTKDRQRFQHNRRENDTLAELKAYYCHVCKMDVKDLAEHKHKTSTVHQFSCQYRPTISSYGIPESNRGYRMLMKVGWDPNKGLGSRRQGQKYPVKTVLKQDRLGFGVPSAAKKLRVTHFSAYDEDAVRTSAQRNGAFKEPVQVKKKDIVRAVEKERRWESRMRRYMNTD